MKWSLFRHEIWHLTLPVRDWDLFCRWIALGVIVSLWRPFRFQFNNPGEWPVVWDPIALFQWSPAIAPSVLQFFFVATAISALWVIVRGGTQKSLAALALFAVTFWGLQHGFKYLHHRDALLALTALILAIYPPVRGARMTSEPVVAICALWAGVFFSASLNKIFSPAFVLTDPHWLRTEATMLLASGRWVNPLWMETLRFVGSISPKLLIGINLGVAVLEFSAGAFFIGGFLWVGWIGAALLCAFNIGMGIAFTELAWTFPAWLLLRRMRHAAR